MLVSSYQNLMLDPIIAVIVLHNEQNKARNREGAKEQPDPIREPPPNRAPKRLPPHFSPAPPTAQHQINNPERPISLIRSKEPPRKKKKGLFWQ